MDAATNTRLARRRSAANIDRVERKRGLSSKRARESARRANRVERQAVRAELRAWAA